MKKLFAVLVVFTFCVSLQAAQPSKQDITNTVNATAVVLNATINRMTNSAGKSPNITFGSTNKYGWLVLSNGNVGLPSINSNDSDYQGHVPGINYFNTNGSFMARDYAWSDHDGPAGTVEFIRESQHNLAFVPGGDGHGGRIQQGQTSGVGQWTQFQYDSRGFSATLMFATLGSANASMLAVTNSAATAWEAAGSTSLKIYNPAPLWVDPSWTGGTEIASVNSNSVTISKKFFPVQNQLPVLRSGWVAFSIDTTPRYLSLSGFLASSTETSARSPGSANMYAVTNLCVYVSGLGSGTNLTVTLLTNAVSTGLLVSMNGAGTAAQGCDTTHIGRIPSSPNGGFANFKILGNNASTASPNIEISYEILPVFIP